MKYDDTCQIYRNGALVTKCQISVNAFMGKTHHIYYSYELRDNAFNESLSAEDDGQTLFLKPNLSSFRGQEKGSQLTQEGASEYFWSMLIDQLQ